MILIESARELLRKRYRERRHTAASALRAASGGIYLGVSLEACGYGPCAEQVALGAAFTAGESGIKSIVAVGRGSGDYPVISPCGNCRQLLSDYAPDCMVILDLDGEIVKAAARTLLPGAYRSGFAADFLEKE